MKKLIALLLIAVICLSFVACGGGSAKKEIVGEWKHSSWLMSFNDDGTGSGPDGGKLTWIYDNKEDKYVVTFLTYDMEFDVSIKTDDDGNEYLTIKGQKYYRYDKPNKSETEDETPILFYENGKAKIDPQRFGEYITEVIDLNVDNWHNYIGVITYTEEVIEKDPFGEIVSTNLVERTVWGMQTDKYYRYENIDIELKNVATGEKTIYSISGSSRLNEDFDITNYICTRIQGKVYIVDLPQEAIDPNNSSITLKDSSMEYSYTINPYTNCIGHNGVETWAKKYK